MAINYSKSKYKNTQFGGTEGIVVPNGDSSAGQRGPGIPGQIRYNTDTNLVEQFTGTGAQAAWKAVDAPPVANNYSGTINEDTDSTITVTGSNFTPGAVISVVGNAVSGVPRNLVTTYVDSGELTANTNASAVGYVGGASYDIRVTNSSGLSSEISPAGTVDRDPVWSTAQGSLGTFYDREQLGVKSLSYTSGPTTYNTLSFLAPTTHQWTAPFSGTIDVLVVAGGGGGGGNLAGGGGAGGVIETTKNVVAGTTYNITVGRGGEGISSDQSGLQGSSINNGGDSNFDNILALGGGSGGGGSSSVAANSGGSGGGASGYGSSSGAGGTPGQGNSGGNGGGGAPNYGGGGGGGAGEAGQNGTQSYGGKGGDGVPSSILGTTYYFGGGGGGCTYTSGNPAGNGGRGGGGGGASNSYGQEGDGGADGLNLGYPGISLNYQTTQGDNSNAGGAAGGNAGDNTGGGGGGAPHQNQRAGNGGSGVVIIRWDASLSAGETITSLSASDPDGDSVSYSVSAGSFPQSNIELETSTGNIKGYIQDLSSTSTSSSVTVAAVAGGQTDSRAFNLTFAQTPRRQLVFSLNYDSMADRTSTSLGTVADPIRKTWDQMSETSESNVTSVDWETYPFWNTWSHAVFSSRNRPGVQWRFDRSEIEPMVKLFMSPYADWETHAPGFNTAANYVVTPTAGSTNWTGHMNSVQFQGNNGGTESGDIPTLGRVGGNVWSTGMYWGQIDAGSNYGGVLNTPYPHSGSGGSATGDTLHIFLEFNRDMHPTSFDNLLTPSGPLGNAQSFTWNYSGSSGIGGSPSNLADAGDHNSSSNWPSDGFQQQGNDNWISVDLGQATTVDYTFAIGYYNGSHMSNQNLIQASNDNSNWTTVSEWSFHPGGFNTNGYLYGGTNTWNSQTQGHRYSQIVKKPEYWIPVNNRTAYRYWRIRGTNFNSSNGYMLVTNWGLMRRK
jgi:hypothetical protein